MCSANSVIAAGPPTTYARADRLGHLTMGSGELGELPQDARADSPEERKPAAGRHERAQPRRAAAETQTRDEYGESMRSQGDPIPGSTGHESPASHESPCSPAAGDKRPVERPPPDEPGDRERAEPKGGDNQAPGGAGRRVDLDSEPAQEQPSPAESAPREAGADSGLSPGDPDQAKAPADDPGTDNHPLWHFHADFKGAHYDWYLPGPDTQPTSAETRDAPPAERAGDLIANLEDAVPSRISGLLREIAEEGEHIPDADENLAGTLTDLTSRPASSAHAVADTRVAVTPPEQHETETGTAMTGLVLLAALSLRGGQAGIHYWLHRKDSTGDQHRASDRAPDPADQELR